MQRQLTGYNTRRHFPTLIWRERKDVNANPILLQKKYARVVELFAKENGMSLEKSLDVFYRSELYELMSEGVSDIHCMSDEYLVRELEEEKRNEK